MAFILRSWQCLNRRCKSIFDHGDPNPACPKCGNVRVQWVPGGGHIAKVAPGMDRTLRGLANRFGLTDMGQRGGTHAGEAAKPDRPTPRPVDPSTPMYRPAPGFEVPWSAGPTAAFSSQVFPLGSTSRVPINGPKFKRGKQGLPTQVVGTDNRKIAV